MPRPCCALLLAILLTATAGCANKERKREHSAVTVHTITLDYANVHLLEVDGARVLVDANFERNAATLLAALDEHGITRGSVDAILVTHGHHDHAGGAPALRDALDAPIWAGRGDAPTLEAGRHLHTMCPVGRTAERRLDGAQHGTYTPFAADVLVDAATPLDAPLDLPAVVVPMTSHTAGSLVLVAGEVAFVGDLFRGAIVGRSAQTHFYMCDLDANLADIQRLLADYPAVQTYYTGHFGPISRARLEAYVADRVE